MWISFFPTLYFLFPGFHPSFMLSSLHLLVSMPISVCQHSLLCAIFTSSSLSMLSYSQLLSHMSFCFYCFFLSVPPVAALLLHLFLSGLHSIYLDILNFCLFPLFSPHQNSFLSSFLSLGPTTRVLSYLSSFTAFI